VTTLSTVPALTEAATVIVLREHDTSIEVLMTRRHANLSFMGGMWVFPGGSLAASDSAEAAHRLIYDPDRFVCSSMCDSQGTKLDPQHCRSLAIAACRETFEESGLLLARHHDGTPCNPELAARLQAQRLAVIKQPSLFVDLLLQEQLRLDVESLLYWAHWITPSAVSRRFDTRFFIVAAPHAQQASTDTREATEHCWMSPAQLLAAHARGEMALPHPTETNLIELDDCLRSHTTVAALLQAQRQRQVPPILPKVVDLQQQRMVVMPWDPDYHSCAGEGTPSHLAFPANLCALPARVAHARG
jgi:8-oxo-dGTP pyrophosphatase MutT (NUDIX family)